MAIVMDMSSYETERDSEDAQYGADVMYAGWNPAIALSQQLAVMSARTAMPDDLAAADAGEFLQRMYTCQR